MELLTVLGSRHIAGECFHRSDVRKESIAGFTERHQVWVFFGWARPRFLVVLLDLRRNANLAGGFAGRLVLVVRFVFVYLICLRF